MRWFFLTRPFHFFVNLEQDISRVVGKIGTKNTKVVHTLANKYFRTVLYILKIISYKLYLFLRKIHVWITSFEPPWRFQNRVFLIYFRSNAVQKRGYFWISKKVPKVVYTQTFIMTYESLPLNASVCFIFPFVVIILRDKTFFVWIFFRTRLSSNISHSRA